MRKGLEFNLVSQGQYLESNRGMSDFRAHVLILMFHRERNGKYGLFLIDHVSSSKDGDQIISGHLRFSYGHDISTLKYSI